MKLTILGFWGGTPEQGGATSGYLLQDGNINILIDCGSGVLSKLSQIMDITQLSTLLLTHWHFDHMADLPIVDYRFNRALRNSEVEERLTVLAPAVPFEMKDFLQLNHLSLQQIEDQEPYRIGNLTINFLPVKHTIACYAVKISNGEKTFVFSGDSAYYEDIAHFAEGADVFLCEATNVEGSIHSTGKGHMNGLEAGKLAKLAEVKQLILTHLPSDGNFNLIKANAESEYDGEVLLANEVDEVII